MLKMLTTKQYFTHLKIFISHFQNFSLLQKWESQNMSANQLQMNKETITNRYL